MPLIGEAHIGAMSLVVIYSIQFGYVAHQPSGEGGGLLLAQ
jgi:hypothetical protein